MFQIILLKWLMILKRKLRTSFKKKNHGCSQNASPFQKGRIETKADSESHPKFCKTSHLRITFSCRIEFRGVGFFTMQRRDGIRAELFIERLKEFFFYLKQL